MFRLSRSLFAEAASADKKLLLQFVVPNEVLYSSVPVDAVYIPSRSGVLGVMPGHEKTVAELKPGVVSVHKGSVVDKYFVSGGFAFVYGKTADIQVVEAVKLENLDKAVAEAGLAEFTAKLPAATTPEDKAIAQIGIEVYSSMCFALGLKK